MSLAEGTPQSKMGPQGGMCRSLGLREMLSQAEGRNGKTTGKACSHPRRLLLYQMPSGLYWAVSNSSGFGAGFLRVSRKAPTRKNVEVG